jgi:hypothetical protein
MNGQDPLRVRLFGYGMPYQVRWAADGSVLPLAVDAAAEAERLADELADASASAAVHDPSVWAVSMPFGRCGVDGLPREYLLPLHLEEGYLDVLTAAGPCQHALVEGAVVRVVPNTVIRLRARPRPGRRVLVAFQTEDRTPLLGNAAPLLRHGELPGGYAERLVRCHGDFAALQAGAVADLAAYRADLQAFFAAMATRLAEQSEVAPTQARARAAGSYRDDDPLPLFARQAALLSPAARARIRAREDGLFRFPGMFGAVASLAKLVD